MQQPYFINSLLGDGPPSPSPTRSKKRKREGIEDFNATPTKSRFRTASSQTLGLATPVEKQNPGPSPLAVDKQSQRDPTPPFNDIGSLKLPVLGGRTNSGSQFQQHTPPLSVSPSTGSAFDGPIPTRSGSPTRTRASLMAANAAASNSQLPLHLPALIVQPSNSPHYLSSMEAAVLSLRQYLASSQSETSTTPVSPEQECHAWLMFAELGMQTFEAYSPTAPSTSLVTQTQDPAKSFQYIADSLPSWAPQPLEIENAISRCTRLIEQTNSLRPLRHQLTLMHARLVFMQGNSKHAKVILKRLLPTSADPRFLPVDRIWSAYEVHLSITNQILSTPIRSLSGAIDVQSALSQLAALAIMAESYSDTAIVQLTAVIRLTLLFQNYESSDIVDVKDIDLALGRADALLGLDGFDKPKASNPPGTTEASTDQPQPLTTPGSLPNDSSLTMTPLTLDILAGGTSILANSKTPAFPVAVNPLGANVYVANHQSIPPTSSDGIANFEGADDLVPPYLRYLRVQVLMIGILWMTQQGSANHSAERMVLLHDMMDKLYDLSTKGDTSFWSSESDVGVIEIPLVSNPQHPLRIQATHSRVLYQLTYIVSAIGKRDGTGRKPKRMIFAGECLKVGVWDDPRVNDPTTSMTDGGPALDCSSSLGMHALLQAQRSIQDIRANAYCELISGHIMRSEYDIAEESLSELVSFIRSCDVISGETSSILWDQYSSRVTLLYGQLAHSLGQSERAIECYRFVADIEEDGSLLWGMATVGELLLRIGLTTLERRASQKKTTDPQAELSGGLGIWKEGERETLVHLSSGVVERCLSGIWGEHMAVIGRIINAALSDEIVRTKSNLKMATDLATKSRDKYTLLPVFLLTASQYHHTFSEHALNILEMAKHVASTLGPIGSAEDKEEAKSSSTSKATQQYHVGHARAGLWIGERYFELFKRRNDREKASKQHAMNSVFEKAVQELDKRSIPPLSVDILWPKPKKIEPEEPHFTYSPPKPTSTKPRAKAEPTKRHKLRLSLAFSQSSDSDTGPPESQFSATSRSSRHSTSQSTASAMSTGTRRSVRSTASKVAIIESDEDDEQEEENDYEESEDDD